jgi:hypothetical protein
LCEVLEELVGQFLNDARDQARSELGDFSSDSDIAFIDKDRITRFCAVT